jgi:hypothetical protein
MSAIPILIVGVALVLTLPLVARFRGRRFDPFEPIVLFALAWGAMFVVRPAAILIRDDRIFYGVDILPTLDLAVFLALVGAVAFLIGYEAPAGRRVAGRLPAPAPGAPSMVLGGAAAIALLGVLALGGVLFGSGESEGLAIFLRGRSSELNDLIDSSSLYLWWASLLVIPAALVAYATALATRRPVAILVTLFLVALVLLRTIPAGNRTFLLIFLGGGIVLTYLARGTRPRVLTLLAALVLALLGSYALLNFRYEETRGYSGRLPSPAALVAPVTRGADAEMAPALAGALLVVPDELSYRLGGATIGELFRRPIPREVWRTKPEPPGQQVVSRVWPEAKELGNFDPAFTPLLFFYWDFGVPGVLVGMAAYGLFARALFEYFRAHSSATLAQLLLAIGAMYVVVVVRTDPVFVFVHSVILLLPPIALFALTSPQVRQSWRVGRLGRRQGRTEGSAAADRSGERSAPT